METKEMKFWYEGKLETATLQPIDGIWFRVLDGKLKDKIVHTLTLSTS